jgi:uncharacterized YkwD family protein
MMKKRFFAVVLAFSLILATSCTQQQEQQQQQKPVGGVESSIAETGDIERIRITADNANVRTGCSNNAPVLQPANKNQTYDVISSVEDWFAVKLPNNQIGFVPQEQGKPVVVEDKKPEMPPETTGTAPQAPTAPKTPTAKTNSSTVADTEQQMLQLVNQARAQNNLPALKIDMEVTNVARIKSQDMIDNNYFSHNSPKYGSPFDMMKSFGVDYVSAGENIAGNQDVQSAHNALMNSPGHRKNILSPDFTHIGIGIKKGGSYGNMFTQMFVSKPK